MQLYLITQEPREAYRRNMVVKIAVVEAKTKRGALSMIAREFDDHACFKKPVAQVLRLDHCYRL